MKFQRSPPPPIKTIKVSYTEACAEVASHSVSPCTETVAVKAALSRTLADHAVARLTLPATDVSAMDGYAVRFADVINAGQTLELIGQSLPCHPFEAAVGPFSAVRVFTGAPVPHGADHILIQEDATPNRADSVRVVRAQTQAKHIRRAGSDFKKGDTLLCAGSRLGPADLAIAAAGDLDTLPVSKRPKMAVLATGSELRLPGSKGTGRGVVSSNSVALAAMASQLGAEVVDLGIAKDDPVEIAQKLSVAQQADLIVVTGGASVGDYDHSKAAALELGAKLQFTQIAMKPGKPTWFATLGSTPLLGLPGNPAAAFIAAFLLLPKLLCIPGTQATAALCGADLQSDPNRDQFIRSKVQSDGATAIVTPLIRQDTSWMTSLRDANCLVWLPAGAQNRVDGDRVTILPFFD